MVIDCLTFIESVHALSGGSLLPSPSLAHSLGLTRTADDSNLSSERLVEDLLALAEHILVDQAVPVVVVGHR